MARAGCMILTSSLPIHRVISCLNTMVGQVRPGTDSKFWNSRGNARTGAHVLLTALDNHLVGAPGWR